MKKISLRIRTDKMGADYEKFTVTRYSVSSALGYLDSNNIAIPEI